MEEDAKKKLDAIYEEVKAVHTRHDHNDQRVEHLHHKMDRFKRLISLLFKGDAKEFLKEWNNP